MIFPESTCDLVFTFPDSDGWTRAATTKWYQKLRIRPPQNQQPIDIEEEEEEGEDEGEGEWVGDCVGVVVKKCLTLVSRGSSNLRRIF